MVSEQKFSIKDTYNNLTDRVSPPVTKIEKKEFNEDIDSILENIKNKKKVSGEELVKNPYANLEYYKIISENERSSHHTILYENVEK